MKKQHLQWLMELTTTPTAAGREGAVIAWVERWLAKRDDVAVERDRFGNLLLSLRKATPASSARPVVLTAHMDHPAFVVREQLDDRHVLAEFRGWVHDDYFVGTKVQLFCAFKPEATGVIETLDSPEPGSPSQAPTNLYKQVRVAFRKRVSAEPGDVLTWKTGKPRTKGDRLIVPACDDLAGVAAALCAFDDVRKSRRKTTPDMRVLLTRAEEIGFIGAMGACRSGLIPKRSVLINIENSKSFADSPIGGGPILRVGDRTSAFDADLDYRLHRLAESLAKGAVKGDEPFRFQRRLMPGGTCEASAFVAYGYAAGGVCLPLGNYHNMNEATGKIDSETISLSDFANLVKLLAAAGRDLLDPATAPPLRDRLDPLWDARRIIIESPAT